MTCLTEHRSPFTRKWPEPANWFFILLGFIISAFLACKAQSADSGLRNEIIVAQAQPVVGRKASDKVEDEKKTSKGKESARKYFKDENKREKKNINLAPTVTDHYMSLAMSFFADGDSFSWGGTRKVEDSGNFSMSVGYRIGEWTRSMDLLFRAEVTSYKLPEGKPVKIAVMPVVQFPEASSGFPLYFGLGLGMGVFTKQIDDESPVAIEYTLLGGLRLFNLFRHTGFFVEGAIKNHFHASSSGQFNGTAITTGAVFTF